MSGGAASAPAPAFEPRQPKIEEKPRASAEDLFEQPAEAVHSAPAPYAGSAPSFTFGGAAKERESDGGSKKVLIGVAAALLIVVGGYFAWSHFKGTNSSAQPAATSAAVSAPEASTPAAGQPATATTATTAPASQPDITLGGEGASSANEHPSPPAVERSRPSAGSTRSANAAPAPTKSTVAEKVEKPAEEEQPETPALIVKGGKVPAAQPTTPPPADAQAPSMIGMGASTPASLPNLGTSNSEVKPKLQTVSVSQGVSQGLLYKKVAPSYPQNALRMHIEGTVELLATISKDGNITQIKVVSGDAQLVKAASDAVKQWKYKPYLLNGEPVEIQTQVTVNFKLPH
jgi:periplasmic protein TonB